MEVDRGIRPREADALPPSLLPRIRLAGVFSAWEGQGESARQSRRCQPPLPVTPGKPATHACLLGISLTIPSDQTERRAAPAQPDWRQPLNVFNFLSESQLGEPRCLSGRIEYFSEACLPCDQMGRLRIVSQSAWWDYHWGMPATCAVCQFFWLLAAIACLAHSLS